MIPFKETIETKQELIDACRKGFDDYCAKRITKNDFLMYFGFTHGEAIRNFYKGDYEQLLLDGGFNSGSNAYFSAGINAWKNLSDGIYEFPPLEEDRTIRRLNLNLPLQQIFYGAPGTGKSNTIKREVEDQRRAHFRTTFHPDSDYSTFVGCYKPTMAEAPVRDGSGHEVKEAKQEEKNRISYCFVPQSFTKAYCEAWNKYDGSGNVEPVFLIIEEINRGNCAQIFGDIFQLLDREMEGARCGFSTYPIDADEDLKAFLESGIKKDGTQWLTNKEGIKDGKLCLPPNLYIWATMNTSDQSLFPIDSAFKRRWDWKYVPIEYNNNAWTIVLGDKKYSWVKFQKKINEKIFEATQSEDKQMGDFFVKADANDEISESILLNKILFYLWNDVCKDGDGDIFKINTNLEYSKELDSSKNEDITFSKFFNDTETKLQQWMHYLGIEPIDGDDEEKEDENHQLEEGVKPAEAKAVTYSKPEYKTLVENMLSQIPDEDVSIFQNGFDWSFTVMPSSYARMSLSFDAAAKKKKSNVKLWIPSPSGYRNSAACFTYLKENNGDNIVRNISEKFNCQSEELGVHSSNANPVVGWKVIVPTSFAAEKAEAESNMLLQIMKEMRTAFDPIITDFWNNKYK